jgi:hypothetical protein
MNQVTFFFLFQSRSARVLVDISLPPARIYPDPQHHRQVVHARQCRWTLFTQHSLPQPKYLSTNVNKGWPLPLLRTGRA